MSNKMPIAEKSSDKELETDSLTTHPSFLMCERSTEDPTVTKWIASLPDFRVSPSVLQDNGDAQTTSETCGPKPFALLEKLGPNGFFWKTSQACLFPTSEQFSETWPKQGMMQDGRCYRLPASAHPTDELAFGSLPTPTASPYGRNKSRGPNAKIRPSLQMLAGGPLNPEFVEWLMGWPMGGTDLRPLEMELFRQWLRGHGKN